jgi:saccharopine dehydrogenase-like NADP-dependent oxidoreductase
MRSIIMGAGQMGRAIACGLNKLGHSVSVADIHSKSLEAVSGNNFALIHTKDYGDDRSFLKEYDVVVSALPYHQNWRLAQYCIDNGLRYCDLGGSVPVSQNINSYAKENAKAPIITDMGLAPGWINIIAEQECIKKQKLPTSVTMRVGGLPVDRCSNTLKYSCTWSYDGLINEYKDDCIVLRNGEEHVVRGLEGLDNLNTPIGVLESFFTSGGASHTLKKLKELGVKNCYYKTFRYPGHRDYINFLLNDCQTSDETVIEILKRICPPEDDLVIMGVYLDEASLERVIYHDDQFSAMQKATAFPVASVTAMLGEGLMDEKRDLEYSDINYEKFNCLLAELISPQL